jgi:hypothetical protein
MSDVADPHGRAHGRQRLATPGFVSYPSTDWKTELKMMAVPLVLLGVATWLGLMAWQIFPGTPRGTSVTSFPHIVLLTSSQSSILDIRYNIYAVSRRTSSMSIQVVLNTDNSPPGLVMGIDITPPDGTTFVCTKPPPKPPAKCTDSDWRIFATFDHNGDSGIVSMPIKGGHFGIHYSGSEVAAVLPTVLLQDPGKNTGNPGLLASYYLPSAQRYDWAGDPPSGISEIRASWEEALTSSGFTPGRAYVGTDDAAVVDSQNRALLTGVLAGVAGAALVAAIVEAVHAQDWNVVRAIRDGHPST